MKKLSLAFTLLSSLAFAGTAFADRDHADDGRAPIVDHRDGARDGIVDHRDGARDGIVVLEHHGEGAIGPQRGAPDAPPFAGPMGPPAFRGGHPVAGAPMMPGAPLAQRALAMQGRWSLLAAEATPYRRGSFSIAVPKHGELDQLRLVASERGLDIVAVELTYKKGRSELVRPTRDGAVTIELGRGKLKSITVRYVNRGAGPDAAIRILAKNDARGGMRGR